MSTVRSAASTVRRSASTVRRSASIVRFGVSSGAQKVGEGTLPRVLGAPAGSSARKRTKVGEGILPRVLGASPRSSARKRVKVGERTLARVLGAPTGSSARKPTKLAERYCRGSESRCRQTFELPMSIWNCAPVTARAAGDVRYSTASVMSSVEATGKWSIIEMK